MEAALKPTLFQSEVRDVRKMGNARELKWEMMRSELKGREIEVGEIYREGQIARHTC